MRTRFIALLIMLGSVAPAAAQVSVGLAVPGVSIGIDVPVYPQLVPVPGYPVYYAPQLNSNYFFYDGAYWVYDQDNWYSSAWYNGPWNLVSPDLVPLFVLRVPVSYYRRPPVYFRGWRSDAPPRWGEHWGRSWEQRRRGWDHWNRGSVPRPAPLPIYQRQYSGNRYPRGEQQRTLQSQNYRYQQRNVVAGPRNQTQQTHGQPRQQSEELRRGPGGQPAQQGRPVAQDQRQQTQQKVIQGEPHGSRPQGQERGPQAKGPAQEKRPEKHQEKEHQ